MTARRAWPGMLCGAALALVCGTSFQARSRADVSPPRAAARAPRPTALPPLDVVVPGTLLVRRRTTTIPRPIPGARFVAAHGGEIERWELTRTVSAAQTIEARAALLASMGDELDVELDLVRRGHATPSDDGYAAQWPLALLNAPKAWDVTTGDKHLVVAVIDSGVVDHPDLRDRLVAGYDFISDPASAGDGDGRDPNPNDEGDESDGSSGFHGTHVAGIIGASTNNGIGMAGTDWSCRIQPVRVIGIKRRSSRDSDIADAIRWAAGLNVPGVPQNKTPARIINLSLGGPGYSRVLQDAVLAARERGVLCVGSAGNDASDAALNFPGALEGVLDVAAADPTGALAPYSNNGLRVDLMAPGGALLLEAPVDEAVPGTVWSTSYVRASRQPVFGYAAGTSQAAAYASGVAALVRAAAPTLGPEVVGAVMRRASRMPAAECGDACGAGLVDASLAVAYAKEIAIAKCGSLGCGSNVLAPAPLRPEEGCSVTRTPGQGTRGESLSAGALALVLLVLLGLRRRSHGARHAAWLVVFLSAIGCSPTEATADAQPAGPPTVTIKDPIPTLRDGELTVSVGEGRALFVEVSPVDHVEWVDLRAEGPVQTLGRLGHPPFRFYLDKSVLGASGKRGMCVFAMDDVGRSGEVCFAAVK